MGGSIGLIVMASLAGGHGIEDRDEASVVVGALAGFLVRCLVAAQDTVECGRQGGHHQVAQDSIRNGRGLAEVKEPAAKSEKLEAEGCDDVVWPPAQTTQRGLQGALAREGAKVRPTKAW